MEETREPEVWKDIPGYEGLYQVSSWGNVRSFDRYALSRGNFMHLHKGKLLKINFKGDYPQICLCKNNKKRTFRIHKLVYKLFVENNEDNCIVNHIDCNKSNNYYKNLEKVNNRENQSHYFKNIYEKTSKYIGVSYDKSKLKYPWVASIYYNKTIKLGNYSSELEAYEAYLNALKEYGLENKYATGNQSL